MPNEYILFNEFGVVTPDKWPQELTDKMQELVALAKFHADSMTMTEALLFWYVLSDRIDGYRAEYMLRRASAIRKWRKAASMKNDLTLTKINETLRLVSVEEERPYVLVQDAYLDSTGYLFLVGGNVGEFERVRNLLAKRLNVSDVYSSNPGHRDDKQQIIGHFVPSECEHVPN